MRRIAGHTFEDTPGGRRCTAALPSGDLCNAAWLHVRTATEEDVGKPGFAHIPVLNGIELAEIQSERAAEEARIWGSITACASSPGLR